MNQTRAPFKRFTEGDFINEIRRLNRAISKLSYERDDLQQENQQLKDNWNKLKEWLEEETIQYWNTTILDKMQELEKGNEVK